MLKGVKKGHRMTKLYSLVALGKIGSTLAAEVLASDSEKDAKSQLQEVAQSHCQLTPTYRTVNERGPDHAKIFTVEAIVGDKSYGRGTGFSKQNAAQAAAQEALEQLEQELGLKKGL
jgi:ribonuclease-3